MWKSSVLLENSICLLALHDEEDNRDRLWSPNAWEDCLQGMHQDLMCIRREGTRQGLASRRNALVQLATFSNGWTGWGRLDWLGPGPGKPEGTMLQFAVCTVCWSIG